MPTIFYILYFGSGLILAPFSYAMVHAYWYGEFPGDCPEWLAQSRAHNALLQAVLTIITPMVFLFAYFCFTKRAKHGLKWK